MNLVFLIDQVAVPLYIILAALAALSFWRSLHARWQLSSTYYELERDLARQRFGTSIGWMLAFVLMMVGVLGIQETVAPFLRTELEQREIISVSLIAQDGDFRTATPAPLDGGLNIQPVAPLGENNTIILLTPTLTPTPVGTIVPNAPTAEGCQTRARRCKSLLMGCASSSRSASLARRIPTRSPWPSWRSAGRGRTTPTL